MDGWIEFSRLMERLVLLGLCWAIATVFANLTRWEGRLNKQASELQTSERKLTTLKTSMKKEKAEQILKHKVECKVLQKMLEECQQNRTSAVCDGAAAAREASTRIDFLEKTLRGQRKELADLQDSKEEAEKWKMRCRVTEKNWQAKATKAISEAHRISREVKTEKQRWWALEKSLEADGKEEVSKAQRTARESEAKKWQERCWGIVKKWSAKCSTLEKACQKLKEECMAVEAKWRAAKAGWDSAANMLFDMSRELAETRQENGRLWEALKESQQLVEKLKQESVESSEGIKLVRQEVSYGRFKKDKDATPKAKAGHLKDETQTMAKPQTEKVNSSRTEKVHKEDIDEANVLTDDEDKSSNEGDYVREAVDDGNVELAFSFLEDSINGVAVEVVPDSEEEEWTLFPEA